MMAVGVARPRAQGQAITSTDTNTVSTNPRLSPARAQISAERRAIPNTQGTNMPAILSASRDTGALVPWASSTRRIMPASVVSLPTRSARKVKDVLPLMLPPVTGSPTALSTGMLSPVSMDSSTWASPVSIFPSTGIRSPGSTRMRSPRISWATGTVRAVPSPASTVALSGARRIICSTASPVLRRLLASNSLPSMIRAMITPADSQYMSCTAVRSPPRMRSRE